MTTDNTAPELIVQEWIGANQDLSLQSLRGKVILVEAFQLLCPGCVSHAIPQIKKVRSHFPESDLAVLGIHTVFEHHEAMQRETLTAFMHEYKINFPVAIDKPGVGTPIPQTMNLYNMRGTPTTLLIDKQGQLKAHYFGMIEDIKLGAEIAKLIAEPTE
ncbi:TlpA family protein disulfide reductase [Alteromonadaceae bacterium M269]|nr:TlpA family protein disulfide reductase [Alteromonadaceae bacterium M269]